MLLALPLVEEARHARDSSRERRLHPPLEGPHLARRLGDRLSEPPEEHLPGRGLDEELGERLERRGGLDARGRRRSRHRATRFDGALEPRQGSKRAASSAARARMSRSRARASDPLSLRTRCASSTSDASTSASTSVTAALAGARSICQPTARGGSACPPFSRGVRSAHRPGDCILRPARSEEYRAYAAHRCRGIPDARA